MTTAAHVREAVFTPPAGMVRLQRAALVAGIVGAIACVIGGMVYPAEQFLRSYLLAYMFWLGMTLGCLAILMLTHITSAEWGYAVRRIFEAGALNVLPMAAFFLPIAAGVPRLYIWARPEVLASDATVQHQHPYLSVPGFLFRALLYFVVWGLLAVTLARWSRRQDSPPDREYRIRYQNFSAVGLILYVFTITFASIDWMMSLTPHWRSTIYGFYVAAGQGLSGFALCIIVVAALMRYRPLNDVISVEHVHDLAKLMFAFVILWAYMAFSQGLIYWVANLPEEIKWYLDRTEGGWWIVGLALLVLHFLVPFFVLLSQEFKRNARRIAVVAGWMLVMRWVDLYWLIIPSFPDTQGHFSFSWLSIATTLALGGFWVQLFLLNLRRAPLVPLHDPMLYEVLGGEHAH